MAQPVSPESADALALVRRRIRRARRRAMTAALAPCIRPVDDSFWCGAQPGRRYWADCYRRACDYLLAHSPGDVPYLPSMPIDGLLLVHGYRFVPTFTDSEGTTGST